jgi:hypothetical protein
MVRSLRRGKFATVKHFRASNTCRIIPLSVVNKLHLLSGYWCRTGWMRRESILSGGAIKKIAGLN